MTAATIDGYALAAIALAAVVVLVLAGLAARLMRDHGVRLTRVGVFVEREQIHDDETRKERETEQ